MIELLIEPQVARGGDVYAVEAVRAAVEFGPKAKSKARKDPEAKIQALELRIARLLEAERRRADAESQKPNFSAVKTA